MRVAIHVNLATQWQPRYGDALLAGLKRRGHQPRLVYNRTERDDLTIVQGPNWCRDLHRKGHCIYIDRAFWGDPDAVSVHWLSDNKKVYNWSGRPGRYHPPLQPMKAGNRVVVLNDYGEDFTDSNSEATIRSHPGRGHNGESLEACLARHDIAMGGCSTAMVAAAIAGLRVVSHVKPSPVEPLSNQLNPDRESWIRSLSWHNWTFDEIERGDLWSAYLG